MPEEEQEVWLTLSSHPRVLRAPELCMPLFCAPPTLSCVLGGGTLRTCVLRPPGIYGPEEQRHLPRVAVRPPSLPRTRGRRSQVDVLCMLMDHGPCLGALSQPETLYSGRPPRHLPVHHPQTYEGQSSQCAIQASVQDREKESYDPREIPKVPQGSSLSQAASEGSSRQKTLEKSGY